MFVVFFLFFFALLHLPMFRKRALWNEFGERVAWALGLPLALAGILHLVLPEQFQSMVPDWLPGWLPKDNTMILAAGGALVVGGAGILIKKFRRMASFGVIGMLASFLPANWHIVQDGFQLANGDPIIPAESPLAWANLGLQAVPMALAWFVGRK